MCDGFDTFRDGFYTQLLTHRDHCRNNGGVVRISADIAYKRLIHFDFVHRKTLQIAQARITGAKVINGDFHADLAQVQQRFDGLFGVLHDAALGNFQPQPARIQIALCEYGADQLQQIAAAKLRRRDVDGNCERGESGVFPHLALLAGRAQDPFADGYDQTSVLCQRNKVCRCNASQRFAVPADQCFHADKLTGFDLYLRLEIEREFVALKGVPQLDFHTQPASRVDVHVGAVELPGIALLLGMVHRDVGVFQ